MWGLETSVATVWELFLPQGPITQTLHVAPRAERVACFSSSRLLAPREYCWIGFTKKSYDPVVGTYASPVFALVDGWADIFFRSMPIHRNPVAYLLRVAAAPKGLNFGKMRDGTTVCVLRTIRNDSGHTQRAKV